MPEPHRGDLAVVLHSHMPYVEGFGTYPFGEEWLFDAAARSYLPLLEFVHDLTLTVTPVLADQLEAPGVAERMREFISELRLGAAEREIELGAAESREAAIAEAERYGRGLELLDSFGGDVVGAIADVAGDRNLSLLASSATHAVLPLLATTAGRRLQIDAGLRSHERRFGPPAGFWLPECAFVPGIDELLAERGVEAFCVDQSRHETDLEALAPIATEAGPVAFAIDWPTIELAWSWGGYPSDPAYAEFHRKSMQGIRVFSIDGGPYRPDVAAERADEQAGEFLAAVAERLSAFSERRGRNGLVVFAIDTELLGHWWSEGPLWLERVLAGAPEHGIRLVNLETAIGEHEAEKRPLEPASWGERKDLSTWDSPAVADMAWAARKLELRVVRAVNENGLGEAAAERAVRELLAVQASDWAFLDQRGQAGDYAYQRAVQHSRALLEAIDSPTSPDPRMRNLAPDMSLAPLREP